MIKTILKTRLLFISSVICQFNNSSLRLVLSRTAITYLSASFGFVYYFLRNIK